MRRIATVVVLVLVLAACGGGGGGGDDATSASSSEDDTTTTSTAAETADGSSTTTSAAPAASPSTTATPTDASAVESAAPGSAAPAPLPAGTYRYRQSGSAKVGTETYDAPPEGKLVADAAGADGKQVLHRYIDPNGEPSDSTMRFGADGMFILDTLVRMGETEIRCTFEPPLAAPPWPPTVGATSSGHGDCGSMFSTDVASEITEARTVDLDGRTYDAVVVRSVITTTGQFESKTDQVDWFVPELRMSVHTEQEMTGRFGTFTFESSGTSDLLSATPT